MQINLRSLFNVLLKLASDFDCQGLATRICQLSSSVSFEEYRTIEEDLGKARYSRRLRYPKGFHMV